WVNTNVSPIYDGQGRIVGSVAVVIDVSDRKRAEEELAAAKDRLTADLSFMTRLQRIGSIYVREGDLPAALTEAVCTAVALSRAQKGNLQLVDPGSRTLTMAAQHGFEPSFVELFRTVREGEGCCGSVLARRERVIVEDVATSELFADGDR